MAGPSLWQLGETIETHTRAARHAWLVDTNDRAIAAHLDLAHAAAEELRTSLRRLNEILTEAKAMHSAERTMSSGF